MCTDNLWLSCGVSGPEPLTSVGPRRPLLLSILEPIWLSVSRIQSRRHSKTSASSRFFANFTPLVQRTFVSANQENMADNSIRSLQVADAEAAQEVRDMAMIIMSGFEARRPWIILLLCCTGCQRALPAHREHFRHSGHQDTVQPASAQHSMQAGHLQQQGPPHPLHPGQQTCFGWPVCLAAAACRPRC